MNEDQVSALIANMTKSLAAATSEQGVTENKVAIELGQPEIVLPGGMDLGFGNTNTPVTVSIIGDLEPISDFTPTKAVWCLNVGFYFADCDLNNPDFKYSSEIWSNKLKPGDSHLKWVLPRTPDTDVVSSAAVGLSVEQDRQIFMALISNIFSDENKEVACGFFDAVLKISCELYEEQKTDFA